MTTQDVPTQGIHRAIPDSATAGQGASPFHDGEQQVQSRLGVRDIEDWARKIVRPHLPEQHRAFHTALPFLVAGARDRRGRPWATLLVGPEGFVQSPDPKRLHIDARPVAGDALEGALAPGADLGLLGIDLATRRRNRVNGRIAQVREALVFEVEQSFGNCPQYIHEREWQRVDEQTAPAPRLGKRLTTAQRGWIERADTFFLATGYRGAGESRTYGMDASHRGGDPGFIEIEKDTRLSFPDYAGNNHFNTIGNLVLDPRIGVLFVDFPSGSMLQLTGRAEITWDGPELERFPGARRIVHIEIEEIVELPAALSLRWSDVGSGVRSLRLIEKIPESAEITSFVFAARDAGPLPPFEAGQHLPVELDIPGHDAAVRRTYSLSNAPGSDHYRISVKREALGVASRHLHDHVEVGEILEARAPAGDFVLGCTECPVALISAGVGLTPMLSMLHQLTASDESRPVWWLHGARDGAHHALSQEVAELEARYPNLRTRVAYSRPAPGDALGVDYDVRGRLDAELVSDFVVTPDAHYYLCGPNRFMAAVQDGLEARGVAAERIHTESFGPASQAIARPSVGEERGLRGEG
jgi:ferredoxin-NADP reductase/predicted pyridoxine 5'-phosphate oxidase superfamily flavin-nucleotide-binding protein